MHKVVQFVKYHALGNDYLVIAPAENFDISNLALKICDRNRGIGADGILIEDPSPADADFAVRIFNPDGSEAEKSGNGLRIFSKWLWDSGRLVDFANSKEDDRLKCKIWTAGGIVNSYIPQAGSPISIEMGDIGLGHGRSSESIQSERIKSFTKILALDGQACCAIPVNLGNPHLVVDTRGVVDLDLISTGKRLATQYGSQLEQHPEFPFRTNVQFLLSASSVEITIAIWERGAGYTYSSGSSACAAAAVAHVLGLSGKSVDVVSEGGRLHVELSDSFQATLTGPVTRVGNGQFWMQ